MSEQKIYHTYKIGNKTKHIKTLTGLKRFSSVNTDNTLSFLELLEKNGFTFHHSLVGEIPKHCRLCNHELPVFKIIEKERQVLLALCPCSVSTPLAVNRNRFLSIISEEKVDEIYSTYCANKMRKWTTAGIPVASLDFKIKKYGEQEGKIRYDEGRKKIDSVSVKFFLSKGYSEEEAHRRSKERQTTFSKQKCIEKYGEEKGLQIWQQRQKKWQATLNNKSIEEIERINQAKIFKSGISKIANNFCSLLYEDGDRCFGYPLGEKMITISINGHVKRAMVDFNRGNKVIEFFGDYWHANPEIYEDNTIMTYSSSDKPLAKDVRLRDAVRIEALRHAGYDIMIVWESDFKQDPEKVISECQKFLNN